MQKLSQEAFARARDFLKTEARLLERTLFELRFEGKPAEHVLTALSLFRNEDGGFGNALEPDVRTPTSSPLATGIALNMLKVIGASPAHPLVRSAIAYLRGTFDDEQRVWRAVPPDANDYPHAPWWHDDGAGRLAHTFNDFQVIPRAQLVGLLHHYAELAPASWLLDLTEETLAAIEALPIESFGGGGDTLVYALALAETEALPPQFVARLLPRLREVTTAVVSRNPEEWNNYVAPPLKIAPLPESPVAELLWEDLQRHLDYLINRQTEEGTWEPAWDWGDAYPDVWKQARQEWRGVLTLDALTSLRAFDRIATG